MVEFLSSGFLTLLFLIFSFLDQVWGCGGVAAIKSQADIKKWESREIEKRKKVNKHVKTFVFV